MSDFNAVLPEDLTIGVNIYIHTYKQTNQPFYSVFNLQFTQHHNLFIVGIVNEINSWIFRCVCVCLLGTVGGWWGLLCCCIMPLATDPLYTDVRFHITFTQRWWCFVWKWTDTLCLPLSSIWQFCSNLALISPSFFSVLAREDHVEGRQHYLAAECVQLRREWRCLQTSTFVEGIGFCFSSEFKCLCLWHEYCNCFFLPHGSVWRIKGFFSYSCSLLTF